MNEKVCPLCGARYQSIYRFCPLDASPLIDAEAPAPLAREPEPSVVAADPDLDMVVEAPRGRGPVTRRVVKGGTKSRTTEPKIKVQPAVEPEPIAVPDGVSVHVGGLGAAAAKRAAADDSPATRLEKQERPAADATRVEEAAPAEASPPPAKRQKRFSETEWFRRPIKDAEVDPESGRVAVSEDDYKADQARRPEDRRGYTLEKLDD